MSDPMHTPTTVGCLHGCTSLHAEHSGSAWVAVGADVGRRIGVGARLTGMLDGAKDTAATGEADAVVVGALVVHSA